MASYLDLDKTYTIHLSVSGEVCNRLACGTRVWPVQRKGDWIKITWRKGKKKGWIFYPNPCI